MRTPFNPQFLVQLDFHGKDQHLIVTRTQPLLEALTQSILSADTPVLSTTRGDTMMVFQTRHFSLYNVMQGELDGQPWMATFCAICNAGMSFSPVVNGKTYTFYGAGFYDGMTLLADHQTESYWDHITGECIAGELKGSHLQVLGNMLHSKAGQLAETNPNARLALTALDAGRAPLDDLAESIRTTPEPQWLPQLETSVTVEDTRLPRFEMGLGIWSEAGARFYPFKSIHALNNLLFDEFEGQQVLIYIDPETLVPMAVLTDATAGSWRGDTVQLDNGQRIRQGVLFQDGKPQPMKPLMQLFQRWYGFSITFPNCDIYNTKRVTNTVPLPNDHR